MFNYKNEEFYQTQNYFINYLFDLYGSDKGTLDDELAQPYSWNAHTYGSYYSKLFDHCRDSIKLVFECGIGTNNPKLESSMGINAKPGASLRAWRDYFSNALIYGADIDKKILFQEDRICTFFLNQENKNDIEFMWSQINKSNFDLMIDDGLHTFEAAKILFENSIKYLKFNGVYIIEDVNNSDLIKFKNYFDQKLSFYNFNLIILHKSKKKKSNNNLLEIRKVFK